MNIHKISKTTAVVFAVITGIVGVLAFLLVFGGNANSTLNGLCFTSGFIMLAAYVVSRFTEKKA